MSCFAYPLILQLLDQVCFELSDLADSVEFAFSHGVLSNGREYAMALPSATAAIDSGVASKVRRDDRSGTIQIMDVL
jgi:hypothetical protein